MERVEETNLGGNGVDLKPGTYVVTLGAFSPHGGTDYLEFHIDKNGVLRTLSPKFLKMTRDFPSDGLAATAPAEPNGGYIGMAVLDSSEGIPRMAQEGFELIGPAILIRAILPDSPAIDAGLLPGDLIDQINGKAVEAGANMRGQSAKFIRQIRSLPPGTVIKLRVLRRGAQPWEVEVRLAAGH